MSKSLFVILLVVAACGGAMCQTPFNFVSSVPADQALVNNPNLQVTLSFNQPAYNGGSATSYISVTAGGGTVPVVVANGASQNDLVLTFPSAPLPDGVCTINFGAVTSQSKQPLTTGPYSISFTLDATPPSLTGTSPSNGATGVALTSDIILYFSEQTTLGAGNPIYVTGPHGPVTLQYITNAVATAREFHPTTPLESGATYTVDYSMALDAAGNRVPEPWSFTFTTSTDTVPPSLVSSDPTNGQTNVARDTLIALTFTEPVTYSPGAPVTLTGPGGAVSLLSQDSPSQNMLSFQPATLLAGGGVYTVHFSGVLDLAGNPLTGPSTLSFTVTPPPTLTSSTPAAGSQNVAIDSLIELVFSKSMNYASSLVTVQNGGPVSGVLTPLESSNTLVFTPTVPLAYSTTYTVNFSAAQDGDGLAPTGTTSFTFTTAARPPFVLDSSSPTAGAANVSVGSQIELTFSDNLASTALVTLRSGLETVAGNTTVLGKTLEFVPTAPLRFGTNYTLDLSGVRDVLERTLTGSSTLTFRTEPGEMGGSVDPPVLHISANQVAGVTYMIQNRTSVALTLISSEAQFLINGAVVETVPVPATLTVPANSMASMASDVAISQHVQDLAKTAGVQEVTVVRTFAQPMTPTLGDVVTSTGISIPLRVILTGSLTGAATVTEVTLDVPPDGKTVVWGAEIRAHAFIKGTGSGPISGIWLVDDQPIESFQVNMLAGMIQEVSTRTGLPTQSLGGHKVQLRITRPSELESNEMTYIVSSSDMGAQRVNLIAPGRSMFQPDIAPLGWRWMPMPGAAGYEIAFADNPAALGLISGGLENRGFLQNLVWTDQMVDAGTLALLIRAPSDADTWTPDAEQSRKLAALAPGTLYGAVRAIFAGQVHGDPTTTSSPVAVMIQPRAADIVVESPQNGTTVQTPVEFKWQAYEGLSVSYELAIASAKGVVFRALTQAPTYTLGPNARFKLDAGNYKWRVLAMESGSGIVAASKWNAFAAAKSVSISSAESAAKPAQTAMLLTDGRLFTVLPGASDQVTFIPGDGTIIADQQPTITVTYPKSKPQTAALTLNGVDVTALAAISDTSAVVQAPGVFNEGRHTVGFAIQTESGEQLQATSTFTIALPLGTTAQAGSASAAAGQLPAQTRPLVMALDWNWQPGASNDITDLGKLVVGLNVRGFQQWDPANGSYSAINAQMTKVGNNNVDMTNLAAEANVRKGSMKAMLGDIGSAESDLTAGGLTYRAFNFVSNTAGMKLSASHTLGKMLQRSSIGRAPDMLLVTAENAGATPQRGLKLTYVDSKNSISGGSGFVGPSSSNVLSLSGRTNVGKSGLNLRMEMARSNSDTVTAFGSTSSTGDALYATADGKLAGFNVSGSYRKIASDYTSPASQMLTNDLEGYTYVVGRRIGKFLSTSLNYVTLDNGPNSSSPGSNVLSRSFDLTAAYPNLPSVTFRAAKNEASSQPFVAGGLPAANEDKQWSVTMNYAKTKWNTYLSYSNDSFTDFYDFIDPTVDTPNDRKTANWSVGIGLQPSPKLQCRFDWGQNTVDRWFRPIDVSGLLLGTDGSRQGRFSMNYGFTPRLSSTIELSNWNYTDALGTYHTDNRNLRLRLNYLLKIMPQGGGFILTGEWQRLDFSGTQQTNNTNDYVIMINDSRLIAF